MLVLHAQSQINSQLLYCHQCLAIVLATYDVNIASQYAATQMFPRFSQRRHPFPGFKEHVIAHARAQSTFRPSTQDEGVLYIGTAKAEVCSLGSRISWLCDIANISCFCIYSERTTHLITILDLEDRSPEHLTRVPVLHIDIGCSDKLRTFYVTVLDHFIAEVALMWVNEVLVPKENDAALRSADRYFIMESVQYLQVANVLRKDEEIKYICDSIWCPDPSALALRCCELYLELVICWVAHLNIGCQNIIIILKSLFG